MIRDVFYLLVLVGVGLTVGGASFVAALSLLSERRRR